MKNEILKEGWKGKYVFSDRYSVESFLETFPHYSIVKNILNYSWQLRRKTTVSKYFPFCQTDSILRFKLLKLFWNVECEAYIHENERKTKRTREGNGTLIIKIYVHNVVTCFFNFLSTSLAVFLSYPLKLFLDSSDAWEGETEAFSLLSNVMFTLRVIREKRLIWLLSFILCSPVHCHADCLLPTGHCWNCHLAWACNVREPHPTDDPAHDEPPNYDIRVSAVDRHASSDSREREYQCRRPLMEFFWI